MAAKTRLTSMGIPGAALAAGGFAGKEESATGGGTTGITGITDIITISCRILWLLGAIGGVLL